MELPHLGAADTRALALEVDVDAVKLGLSAFAVVSSSQDFPVVLSHQKLASSSFRQRVMHSVSAAIEYVCAMTAAANVGPTMSFAPPGIPH